MEREGGGLDSAPPSSISGQQQRQPQQKNYRDSRFIKPAVLLAKAAHSSLVGETGTGSAALEEVGGGERADDGDSRGAASVHLGGGGSDAGEGKTGKIRNKRLALHSRRVCMVEFIIVRDAI